MAMEHKAKIILGIVVALVVAIIILIIVSIQTLQSDQSKYFNYL